jgi:hypothetical protein
MQATMQEHPRRVSRSAARRLVQRIHPATFPGRSPVSLRSSPFHVLTFAILEYQLVARKTNMNTVADDNSPEASRGPNPRTAQVRYLTPTPPGFEPEIDYIPTLQAVSEAAGTNTAEWSILFQESPNEFPEWRRRPKACIIDDAGSSNHLTVSAENRLVTREEEVTWMYRQIRAIRQRMGTEARQRTRVLVAETYHSLAIQVLGTALDLDPTFLLRHVNKLLQVNTSESEMAALSRAFSTCIADSRQKHQVLENTHATLNKTRTKHHDSSHLRGQASYYTVANHHQDLYRPELISSSSRISYCRVSTFGCKSFLRTTMCLATD